MVSQIASENLLVDPLTKGLAQKFFDQHVEGMGVRCMQHGSESKWEFVGFVDCKSCFSLVHGSVICLYQ